MGLNKHFVKICLHSILGNENDNKQSKSLIPCYSFSGWRQPLYLCTYARETPTDIKERSSTYTLTFDVGLTAFFILVGPILPPSDFIGSNAYIIIKKRLSLNQFPSQTCVSVLQKKVKYYSKSTYFSIANMFWNKPF